MKWIGTTISVATSIIRPARLAPHLKSPAPNAAKSSVATIASVHLPTGDQSRSPSSMCAPTVELTTIKRTARHSRSSCECDLRNSPAKAGHEKVGAEVTSRTSAGTGRSCPAGSTACAGSIWGVGLRTCSALARFSSARLARRRPPSLRCIRRADERRVQNTRLGHASPPPPRAGVPRRASPTSPIARSSWTGSSTRSRGASARTSSLAVMFLDLDDFKRSTTAWDMSPGDELLAQSQTG